jgi:hypothetical protein
MVLVYSGTQNLTTWTNRFIHEHTDYSACGCIVGWGTTYATSRKVAGSNADDVIGIFNWPNPSSRNMALGPTQTSSRNEYQEFSWGPKDGRLARKAGNLTAVCEPIV